MSGVTAHGAIVSGDGMLGSSTTLSPVQGGPANSGPWTGDWDYRVRRRHPSPGQGNLVTLGISLCSPQHHYTH